VSDPTQGGSAGGSDPAAAVTSEKPQGNKSAPSARSVAARVVERVLRDGAYASAALDAELSRAQQLSARDRALATELVYGSLRARVYLEQRLSRLAKKLDAKDYVLRAQLLLAAYQLLMLDRVPAHAVVDHAVEAIKRARGPRVGGFVNAVLRKLAAEPQVNATEAALASLPEWLRPQLASTLGEAELHAFVHVGGARAGGGGGESPAAPPEAASAQAVEGLSAAADEPIGATGIRLRVGLDAAQVPEWLRAYPSGNWSRLARRVGSVGDPRRLEGFADGRFVIQEEGAQVIALALGARPGERVLDACAGRGQKTTLLADLMRGGAAPTSAQHWTGDPASSALWACDLHPNKLRGLAQELARLGLPPAELQSVDWEQGVGEVPCGFDRVLVDAPCTGVGTLRRRPEIALRLTPEDPERMARLQASILRNAGSRLRPGGVLVYAVCSVLEAECEGVLRRVADVLTPRDFDTEDLPWLEAGCQALRLLPGRHQTDGYFLACLTRRS